MGLCRHVTIEAQVCFESVDIWRNPIPLRLNEGHKSRGTPEVKPCQMKMTRVALLRIRYRTAKMLLKPNSARFHAVVGLVSSNGTKANSTRIQANLNHLWYRFVRSRIHWIRYANCDGQLHPMDYSRCIQHLIWRNKND